MSITSLIHNHWWSALKHCRGEGIHSPYAYDIIREAFVPHELVSHDNAFYEELLNDGVSRRYAVKLQNLYSHLGYAEWLVDGRERLAEPRTIYVMTSRTGDDAVRRIIDEIADCDSIICIVKPHKNSERYRFCRSLIEAHKGLSMDITGCLLLFYRQGLSRQHLKL